MCRVSGSIKGRRRLMMRIDKMPTIGELAWQACYKIWGNAVQEEWIARAPQRPIPSWSEVQAATPTSGLSIETLFVDAETAFSATVVT